MIEKIARWFYYYKNPTMSGESGADASCNPRWESCPEVLKESYRKDARQILDSLKGEGYLSPEEVEEKLQATRKEKDTRWHDNVQRVKGLIKEGKNPQEEKDNNLAYDHWHPELALLWEIALEALKKEGEDD